MKRIAVNMFVLITLFSGAPLRAQGELAEKRVQEHSATVQSQAKTDKEETRAAAVADLVARQDGPQVRVRILFTEYEGEKKTKSLPYTLLAKVGMEGRDGPWSKIRMGSRVPVATGISAPNLPNATNFQYVDVGTNIDCTASALANGRYRLSLIMERSWPEVGGTSETSELSGSELRVGEFREPVIRQFRSDSSVVLREGETLETSLATDPVTGKVIKLEVSLNLVK